MAVFIFLFTSRQGFSGRLLGALGAATKTHKGTANRGIPYTVEGAGQAGKPRGVVFYSDHTDSGSRTRSGKGSKEQAEGMWALVWPRGWWRGDGEEMAATLYYCIWDMGA